ncbi:MAG: hypothetical protein ACTSRH_10495 [Promethearchaeota archaeon]
MNERKKGYYSNLSNLARDSTKLIYQLLKERVLRFNLKRSLEVNTFFLNYFLIQNYFPAIDLQYELIFGRKLTEKESVDCVFFREYIEKLYGIFILIPMKYSGENFYSNAQTDKIINQVDAYGELTNYFFNSYENITNVKIDNILKFLEGFMINYNFLPSLNFDPEFQQILKSKAINQLFYLSTPNNYFYTRNIQRYNYPIEDNLKEEYNEAIKDLNKSLFNFNPNLMTYKKFLLKAANYIAVKDFGSKVLMYEVINNFKQYYTLRISLKKIEIDIYLNCFKILFEITEGKLYKKIRWAVLYKRLESFCGEKYTKYFLNNLCMNKTNVIFPKELKDFNPNNFIKEYYNFLKFACYYYMGFVYTGALLIWRSMMKYFEELQKTDEFKEKKGILLENWCLNQIEKYGFLVEKLILKNINQKPNDNYFKMKEYIKNFNKIPLEFKVNFIENQKKYNFHEIDLLFRFDDEIYVLECKGVLIYYSTTKKYFKWAKKFDSIYELLNKKVDNIMYCINNGGLKHPLFRGVKRIIPIIIQTEGVYYRGKAFTPGEFEQFLNYLYKIK